MNNTDTIIVTWSSSRDDSSFSDDDDDDSQADEILRCLKGVIETLPINLGIFSEDTMQIIKLKSLERILIVCPSPQVSFKLCAYLKDNLKTFGGWAANQSSNGSRTCLDYTFSMKNSNHHYSFGHSKNYLSVPQFDKLFLVSPPQSPTPEFDYSRTEDSPNKHPHPHISLDFVSESNLENHDNNKEVIGYINHSTELLHVPESKQNNDNSLRVILTQELKQYKDGKVESEEAYNNNHDIADKQKLLALQRNTGIPGYSTNNSFIDTRSDSSALLSNIQKTALPPRSIFSDDEDLLDDEEDDDYDYSKHY